MPNQGAIAEDIPTAQHHKTNMKQTYHRAAKKTAVTLKKHFNHKVVVF